MVKYKIHGTSITGPGWLLPGRMRHGDAQSKRINQRRGERERRNNDDNDYNHEVCWGCVCVSYFVVMTVCANLPPPPPFPPQDPRRHRTGIDDDDDDTGRIYSNGSPLPSSLPVRK